MQFGNTTKLCNSVVLTCSFSCTHAHTHGGGEKVNAVESASERVKSLKASVQSGADLQGFFIAVTHEQPCERRPKIKVLQSELNKEAIVAPSEATRRR